MYWQVPLRRFFSDGGTQLGEHGTLRAPGQEALRARQASWNGCAQSTVPGAHLSTSLSPGRIPKGQECCWVINLETKLQRSKARNPSLFRNPPLYPPQLLVHNSCEDSAEQTLRMKGSKCSPSSWNSLSPPSYSILTNSYWVDMVPLPRHLGSSSVSWLFS